VQAAALVVARLLSSLQATKHVAFVILKSPFIGAFCCAFSIIPIT
jgi:hypothetical protein